MLKYKTTLETHETDHVYIVVKSRNGIGGYIKDRITLGKNKKFADNVVMDSFVLRDRFDMTCILGYMGVRNYHEAVPQIDEFIRNNLSVLDHYISNENRTPWQEN